MANPKAPKQNGGASAPLRSIIGCLGLGLLAALVYWRVAEFPFINYDDPDYVTQNPIISAGITSEGLRWAFGNLHAERTYWHPITWISLMLDCQVFGVNA